MKLLAKGMVVLWSVMLSAAPSLALERFNVVTTRELHQLLEERNAGKVDFVLVNALDEMIFKDVSIPGSVNIPWCDVDKTIGRLGANKNRHIITYCVGYR